MTEPPPLRLFLDRSTTGKRFISGIRRLVDDVETIGDRYGVQGAEESSARNLSAGRLLELFERNLPAIRHLTTAPGPWVRRIAQHGMDRLPLDCAAS